MSSSDWRIVIVIGLIAAVMAAAVLLKPGRRELYYTEHSRKFTLTGSSSRWLVGDGRPHSGSRLVKLAAKNDTLHRFLRQRAPNSRELIVAIEDGRLRKAYATKGSGDIECIEDTLPPRRCIYTQTHRIDMTRFFDLGQRLSAFNNRWGHIRTDTTTRRVDAVYVGVLADRVTVFQLRDLVKERIGGREWSTSETEWWESVANHTVTFIGVGESHITLYYRLSSHERFPTKEVLNKLRLSDERKKKVTQ